MAGGILGILGQLLGQPQGGAIPFQAGAAPQPTGILGGAPGAFVPAQFQGAPPVSGYGAPGVAKPASPGFGARLNSAFVDHQDQLSALGAGLLKHRANATYTLGDAFADSQTGVASDRSRAKDKKSANATAAWLKGRGYSDEEVDRFKDSGMLPEVFKSELAKDQELRSAGKPTDDMREYAWAQGDADKLGFLKRGSTTINVGDGTSEGAFAKKGGELQATRFDNYVQQGDSARSMIGDIGRLRDLGSMIDTGKTAEAKAMIGPYAEALGIDVAGLGEAQAYKAIIDRMAPQMRPPGAGATSDFDARQFLSSLPSLGRTPEGNAMIQDTLQSIADTQAQAADIASSALRGDITRNDAEKQIRALPDPYTAWRKAKGAGARGQTTARPPVSPQGGGDFTSRTSSGIGFSVRQ